jgi:hypothetical protein
MGTARWKGDAGNRGRPVVGEGRSLNVAIGDGSGGSRTGSVVPLRPGNAGGGKTLGVLLKIARITVIGDEPGNA